MIRTFSCWRRKRAKSLPRIGICLLATILSASVGCHLPFAQNPAFASDPHSIQLAKKPIIPPNAPNLATMVFDDNSESSHTELSGDSDFTTIVAVAALEPVTPTLFDEKHWALDRSFDTRSDKSEFGGLLELDRPSSLLGRLWDDQKNFYSAESLTLLGGGLIIGGAMANSSIDEGIHRHFQSSVRGATSDDWFESLHASKELGNGMYTLPVFATAWAAGELFADNKLVETSGRWGERSMRGFVVGAPPLILMQQLTGGSRPTETDESSEWHPFRDNNGISGHAFMGSLPFITAAKMTDNRGYKVLFYAGSAIASLSRVNDNAHYPSQVALGWWMAYLAASAIDATDDPNSRWHFYPYSTGDGSGMMAEFRF